MTTSSEEFKSTETLSVGMTKSWKILAVCYYSVIFVVVAFTLIWRGKSLGHGKQCENRTCKNISFPLKQTLLLKLDATTPLQNEKDNDKTLLIDESAFLMNIEIQSNPYNLSKEDIIRQLRTAKVASLKKRVKRFACWHSCFGQFRKKAFRTLYGNLGPLFSSPSTLMLEEKKERKREIGIETARSFNGLDEGESKEELESVFAHDTNSKLNTTDFFKLKTKVVLDNDKDEEEMKSDVWDDGTGVPSSRNPTYPIVSQESTWNQENQDPMEMEASDEVDSNEKEASEESEYESVEEDDYESEEGEENEGDEENEEDESETEGSYEYEEYTTSEELEEDKGDGIDRKDLEEEGRG